ncbi:MAG: 16S rRNA (guanine(527)-N(7))-methyltransferase RsmG [Granulosicoccus sp.]
MDRVALRHSLLAGLSHLEQQGVSRPDVASVELLLDYIGLLVKWNATYNLTAVRSPEKILSRHILDCLILNRWLDVRTHTGTSQPGEETVDVLDVGSGAGLPVLPLAITRPDLQFVSVESNGKKARFQQQAVIELSISNVKIVQSRVQDINVNARWITSRAFAAPADFLVLVEPLACNQTQFLLMLGHADKMPDPLPLPFVLSELVEVDIPETESSRHIAVCRCSCLNRLHLRT